MIGQREALNLDAIDENCNAVYGYPIDNGPRGAVGPKSFHGVRTPVGISKYQAADGPSGSSNPWRIAPDVFGVP